MLPVLFGWPIEGPASYYLSADQPAIISVHFWFSQSDFVW